MKQQSFSTFSYTSSDPNAVSHLQVADLFVVRIAAQQALAQQQRGKLITKSLHAELVYNMSGSRHVRMSSVLLQTCLGQHMAYK